MKNNLVLFLSLIAMAIASPFALAAPAKAKGGSAAALTISTKGEEMAFDKTEFTVKAGQKVKFTFNNVSSMQHNWVLVNPGTADKVAEESIKAGNDKGWLAKGPDVLANTKMIDPKSKDTIEFTAPTKAGDYPFLCTFPGHGSVMRGVLRVK